jgi:hypothetical protein
MVNQIQLFTRQASGGNAVFAIYVDGTATANRVGTFSPPAGFNAWGIRTVNLSTAIGPGTHTLYIGPNATFRNNACIDWFELHNTGGTPPAQCADGQDNDGDGLTDFPNDPGCSSSTDDEETNAPGPDAEAPNTSITSGPAQGSTDTDGNVTFGYSGTDNVGVSGFETRLITPSEPNPAWVDQGTNMSISYNGLANGNYTFEVRARDAAGNRDASPATRSFSVSVSGGGLCTGTQVNLTSNLENIIDNPRTYCLRGGVYEEADEQIVINADNVTVKNVPGERAEIRGRIRTNDGASNFRMEATDTSANVEGIVLNSTYSPVSWSTSGGMGHFTSDPHLIRGNGTTFINVEFDGDNDVLGDPWYTSQPSTPSRAIGTCVLIAVGTDGQPAADVQILNSDVHNCGAPPNQGADNVGTHALYLSGGLRVQVEHNQIYENGTRGVQIRNGTDNTHVYGNVIDENYVGIGFDDPNTNDNIAENNVVTRNANKNIRNLSDAGTGNVARNNCGYGEPIPNGTIGNVSYSNNVNVSSNPYSVDPEPNADAVVSNTTCNAKLPAGSRFLP